MEQHLTTPLSLAHRKSFGPGQALQQAMMFHAQRRLWEAEQLYKRALKADDRHFGSLYHLGLLYLQQKRFDDAARLFRRAVNVDRNAAEAHHHLAVALTALGQCEEAARRYETALSIRPNLAETHNNLGHVLESLGRTREAAEHYRQSLAIRPEYAEAHNNLANLLIALARPDEAITHYEQALAVSPQYVEAYINLGDTLTALDRAEEAVAYYEKGLAIAPSDPRARENLGYALKRLGRTEEEVAHFRRAIAVTPNDAESHNNLGLALQALGKLDEAVLAFERAIALAPKRAAVYWNLSISRRFTADDRHFAAMQELAGDMASLSTEDRIALHFALGKALGDIEDRQESCRHLLQGNSLKRQQITYDEAETLERFERIRTVFTADLIHDKQGLGDPSSVPVFIIGMARSGSTLIEQILASHPAVFGAGELREWGKLALSIGGPNGGEFPDPAPKLSREQAGQLGESYVKSIRRLAPGAERITDKMLANFALVGLIHLALPNARFIHTRRSPRDTALSCFSTLFTTGLEHTYDLAELGRYYRGYRALMEHWRSVLPEGVMLEVQYEEVVEDVEAQARRIVAYCGLEWDDACLAFHKTSRSVRTASTSQVRQPIYRSSVGRWRKYESLLQSFVQALEGL